MIEIRDKASCSGCQSCSNACPVNAIYFEEDDEGFLYPQVNEGLCIHCDACQRVCPMLCQDHGVPEGNKKYIASFFAVQLMDKSVLKSVSSGGAFWGLVQTVLDVNGIVYGAKQENTDFIYHDRATTLDGAKAFRRSKYLPSFIGDSYKRAKKDLDAGNVVLFSGTGCQIAGLVCYLNHEYENLITCEVVCHGVPSMKVWRSYRKEKEWEKKKPIADLIFRDKSAGWSKNQYEIKYSDGSYERERSTEQLFHAGYLKGVFYRPSCGKCPFASLPRTADLTLADYWQYEGKLKPAGEDLGISLIAVNSAKGEKALLAAKKYLNIETANSENALRSCRHMSEHPIENPLRNAFMHEFLLHGYHAAAKKTFLKTPKAPFFKRLIRAVKRTLSKQV